jgi:hypothetical protein
MEEKMNETERYQITRRDMIIAQQSDVPLNNRGESYWSLMSIGALLGGLLNQYDIKYSEDISQLDENQRMLFDIQFQKLRKIQRLIQK